MQGPFPPTLGKQPALDGVRGVAVLVVLGHNLGWKWLQGGFFGVDMFFALSGFLITTLLLEEQASTGRISLPAFFLRRTLRLYPALVALVAFTSVAAVFTPTATLPRVLWVESSVLGYFSNWILAADTGAWSGGLGHTWSLAVEVHFYLLWAMLLAAIVRHRGANLTMLAQVALTIASLSVVARGAGWYLGMPTSFLYVDTLCRLDAVFCGVLAALLRLQRPAAASPRVSFLDHRTLTRLIEAACLLGLAVLVSQVGQGSRVPYVGGFGLAGAATAALIFTSLCSSHSLVARFAGHPLLAWFGKVSYSIYLWHVPAAKVFSPERLAPLGLPPLLREAARVGVTLIIAAASYYVIERYFLKLKASRGREKTGRD